MSEDSKNINKLQDAAEMQHSLIGARVNEDSGMFKRNNSPGAQWFSEAGLGLFIHFGISAVNGKVDLSWGMMDEKPWEEKMNVNYSTTPEQYFKLAGFFNPQKYNPDKWIRCAAKAGFRYAVLTTRHHDGFALWPSDFGEFNTANYMQGRDLVIPFVEACRNNGVKVGLYYSPPDWYYNRHYMSFHYGSVRGSSSIDYSARSHYGLRHEPVEIPEKPEGWEDNFKNYVRGQIIELMSNYGKIDMLWFDGGSDVWDAISIEDIRKLQPDILVNPRMHGHGDFETYECRMPENCPEGWWEHEDIWAEGPWWGYMEQSKKYKPVSWMLSRLAQVRNMDGNFLVNVAPYADGELPEEVYKRFDETEEWMSHSGQSIFGVKGRRHQYIPVTYRDNILYLHFLPEFNGTVTVEGVEKPEKAWLLRTGEDVLHTYDSGTITVSPEKFLRTGLVDVVALKLPKNII